MNSTDDFLEFYNESRWYSNYVPSYPVIISPMERLLTRKIHNKFDLAIYGISAVVMVYILYRLLFIYRKSIYMPFLTAIISLDLVMSVLAFVYGILILVPFEFNRPCILKTFVVNVEAEATHWIWLGMYFQRYISIYYPMKRIKRTGIWRCLNSAIFLISAPIIFAVISTAYNVIRMAINDSLCHPKKVELSTPLQLFAAFKCMHYFFIPFAIILFLDFAVVCMKPRNRHFSYVTTGHMGSTGQNLSCVKIQSSHNKRTSAKRHRENIMICLVIVTIQSLLNFPMHLHKFLHDIFFLYEFTDQTSYRTHSILIQIYMLQIPFKAIAVHLLCRERNAAKEKKISESSDTTSA